MRDNPTVTGLVTRAQNGDRRAWDALVERYAPLVHSICRRYRLGPGNAEDVSQNVWLTLVGQLGNLRDPAALPGWLVTTTRRECLRVLRAAGSPHTPVYLPDAENIPDSHSGTAEQELLIAEPHAALREAFTDLPPRWQQLLALLIEDPPVPYTQISATLGIPMGSIGPIRRRCLDKLRRHPAITALMNGDDDGVEGEPRGPCAGVAMGVQVRAASKARPMRRSEPLGARVPQPGPACSGWRHAQRVPATPRPAPQQRAVTRPPGPLHPLSGDNQRRR